MVDPMHSDPGSVVGEAEHNDGRWCVLAPEHRKCRRCQGSVSHAQTRIRLQPDANEGPPGVCHRGCTTSSPSDPRTDSINDEEVELPGGCTPETGLPSSSGVFFLLPSRRFS